MSVYKNKLFPTNGHTDRGISSGVTTINGIIRLATAPPKELALRRPELDNLINRSKEAFYLHMVVIMLILDLEFSSKNFMEN